MFYQKVTREEKDLIVKAMGLAQGHWFKCPKGRDRWIGLHFFETSNFIRSSKGAALLF